ncbi:MAG: glycoside hydrolase [Candidatus Electrothrix sp. GM3_4]|nr:glycoside hydrolase [Candidatus Electrothrix sp. GM3_4]
MLLKNYTKTKKKCRVTFKCPNQEHADSAMLAGEFNGWSTTETPMKKLKDGSFSITISLEACYSYSFRYVLNDNIWINDPEADEHVANEHGESNSVLIL